MVDSGLVIRNEVTRSWLQLVPAMEVTSTLPDWLRHAPAANKMASGPFPLLFPIYRQGKWPVPKPPETFRAQPEALL